jgi:very-short-patch-repair endonuclease
MTRIRNIEEQKPARQDLRNNGTASEAVLWSLLKERRLDGRKFRRQDGFGKYIVDFHCPDERLVIEIDGSVHDDPSQLEHDRIRDSWLRQQGLRILRFDNKQILDDTESVVDAIMIHFTPEGARRTMERAASRLQKPRLSKEDRQRSRKARAHHP